MRRSEASWRLRARWAVAGLAVVAGVAWTLWPARVDTTRVYRIGYNHNPPFQIHRPQGPPTGFAVDTVERAANRARVRLEWVHDASPGVEMLRRGEVDLWPVMADLPERRAWAYVSDTWMLSDNYLITRGTAPLPPATLRGVIPYSGPGMMQTLLRRLWPQAQTRAYASVDALVPPFCAGEWPFVEVTSHQASAFLREVGVRCPQLEFRTHHLPALSVRLGVGANPSVASVADRLREEIVAMGHDGELGAILARYSYVGLTESRTILQLADAERQRRLLGWALSGLGVALAILALAVWRLGRARAAADAANVAKSDFLANMSHEIRTPLGGVLGTIELALDGQLAPPQRALLDTAHSSARTLLSLLNDILDLSRIEAGRLDVVPIDFQPRALVDEIASLMGPVAHAKGLTCERQIDDDVPAWVRADPVRVRQVLLNLIGNAIKFTERGTVALRIGLQDGDPSLLRVEVRDTGIGVPADKHAAIFEKFRQADGSIVRKFGGTGLGLAISRHLVEMMGGRIWVDSAPQAGSTFFCTLPVAAADPSARPAAAVADAVPGRPLRVLVAEDNPVNQRLLRAFLEKDRHDVVVVESGQAAVDTMRGAATFDVVLMDIQMPEMDGFQATAAIRRLDGDRRTVPIVALTAHAQVGYDDVCRRAGMSGYLSKPLDRAALRRVLAGVGASPGSADTVSAA